MDTKALFENFKIPKPEDSEVFKEYKDDVFVGDRSFSLIYAWQKSFDYAFRKFGESIAVIEMDMENKINIILFDGKNSDMADVISELYNMFSKYGCALRFEYVSEEKIECYKKAAEKKGFAAEVSMDLNYSDYIYETESFISMEGKINKGKRCDYNSFIRNYPDIHIEYHSEKNNLMPYCNEIFDKWCGGRNCGGCVYKCEKTAFLRFMDIFDEKKHKLCVSFSGGKALSFAVSEKINKDTVCYYIQKNAERIRGLTYWLNREMALAHRDVKYINLGEDMGLEGLRADKRKLRPCFMKSKYTIIIKEMKK